LGNEKKPDKKIKKSFAVKKSNEKEPQVAANLIQERT